MELVDGWGFLFPIPASPGPADSSQPRCFRLRWSPAGPARHMLYLRSIRQIMAVVGAGPAAGAEWTRRGTPVFVYFFFEPVFVYLLFYRGTTIFVSVMSIHMPLYLVFFPAIISCIGGVSQ